MRRSSFRPTVHRAITSTFQPRHFPLQLRCAPRLAVAPSSTAANAVAPTTQAIHTQILNPFKFETGHALFAKRAPRPFPPPFLSPPSGSFSDPLSTHHMSRDKRMFVNGDLIKGYTNGDDAVYFSDHFICANDGVGAWSTRPGGHAGLWSRLILHFWALEAESALHRAPEPGQTFEPDPVAYLQKAYEQTLKATSKPNEWQGTTTAAGAQLYYNRQGGSSDAPPRPLLFVTNIGDSQVLVLRPSDGALVYKTKEQWHWFDCPRQLGTNSPDTPQSNAVMDKVEIEEHDVVLAMSDGVIDNLWEHEIIENVVTSIRKWELGEGQLSKKDLPSSEDRIGGAGGGMKFVAEELMKAAKIIATDPFAESPFMEHAVEEGLAMEGGKLDDISVVAALCVRNRDAG